MVPGSETVDRVGAVIHERTLRRPRGDGDDGRRTRHDVNGDEQIGPACRALGGSQPDRRRAPNRCRPWRCCPYPSRGEPTTALGSSPRSLPRSGPGGMPCRRRTLRTALAETATSRCASMSRMRLRPQLSLPQEFSLAKRRIRATVSAAIGGRPPRRCPVAPISRRMPTPQRLGRSDGGIAGDALPANDRGQPRQAPPQVVIQVARRIGAMAPIEVALHGDVVDAGDGPARAAHGSAERWRRKAWAWPWGRGTVKRCSPRLWASLSASLL